MNKNTLADIMQSGFESYLSKTGSLPIHYYKADQELHGVEKSLKA